MSETPQITSSEKKPKDPRRVEAGKRLAAISKAAKEKKVKERHDRESAACEERPDWTLPVVGITVVGLAGLCYVCRRKFAKAEGDHPAVAKSESGKSQAPTPPEPADEKGKSNRKLDSFD